MHVQIVPQDADTGPGQFFQAYDLVLLEDATTITVELESNLEAGNPDVQYMLLDDIEVQPFTGPLTRPMCSPSCVRNQVSGCTQASDCCSAGDGYVCSSRVCQAPAPMCRNDGQSCGETLDCCNAGDGSTCLDNVCTAAPACANLPTTSLVVNGGFEDSAVDPAPWVLTTDNAGGSVAVGPAQEGTNFYANTVTRGGGALLTLTQAVEGLVEGATVLLR